MSTTTLIPDSGFSYANLIDGSDSTFVQTNGESTERLYNLSNTPGDLVTVTSVTVNLRMSQKVDGIIDDFQSAQIFKSDGTTAITSLMEAAQSTPSAVLTGTITNYALVPVTLSYTDKTSWDGALLKLIKNALSEGGPDQGIRYYEAGVDLTYTATEPPTPNSGTVGVENTPELILYFDGIYSLAAATGQVVYSIGNMVSNSTAYSNNDTYGFINNYQLDGIGFVADNQLTILGSSSSNLNNLEVLSIIGNTATNFGNAYLSQLDTISLSGSGYQNGQITGRVLNQLQDSISIDTSGGNFGGISSTGTFIYTSEWERFIGRSCTTLKLESSINKFTTSCSYNFSLFLDIFLTISTRPLSISCFLLKCNVNN